MAQERSGHWAVRESFSVSSFVCTFFLGVLLLLLFTSFAVLVNCPYPDPQVFPFSSHSPPHPMAGRGDKAATRLFVAGKG